MTLDYELTFDDFREAQINHASAASPRRPGRWLLYVTTFVMFYLMVSIVVPGLMAAASSQTNAGQLEGMLWLHFFLPFVVVGAMIFLIAGVTAFRNRGKIGAASRPRGPLAWIVLIILAILLLLTVSHVKPQRNAAGPPSPPLNWNALLLPHIGWAALMTFLTFFIIRSQFAALRRSWERQSHIHGPWQADITAAGLVLTGTVARHDYRWSAVSRHLETPSIFLLYYSEATFQILPKRAFATAEQLEAFRNMAKNLAGQTSSAFEVVTRAA